MENLKLLEKRIDQFLAQHEHVRKERDTLAAGLEVREGECTQLRGQLKQLEHERGELRARLERILSRLDALDLG